jgi:hypothetical protein
MHIISLTNGAEVQMNRITKFVVVQIVCINLKEVSYSYSVLTKPKKGNLTTSAITLWNRNNGVTMLFLSQLLR